MSPGRMFFAACRLHVDQVRSSATAGMSREYRIDVCILAHAPTGGFTRPNCFY